jgi:hypothetical protein
MTSNLNEAAIQLLAEAVAKAVAAAAIQPKKRITSAN